MDPPVTFASCAFFGFRPDRDHGEYYRLLLNDLAAKKGGARLVVATNRPEGFHPGIEIIHVPDITPYRRRLWDVADPAATVTRILGANRRNRRLAQYSQPQMISVYLAKTAILAELAQKEGKVVWLDAGLLFSVLYDHAVPDHWRGYDEGLLRDELQPFAQANAVRLLSFRRKLRPHKLFRPHFHGLSYVDMARLARGVGAKADNWYVAAGAMVLDAKAGKLIEEEFPQVWQNVIETCRCGTEETVLSILRWKHAWPADPFERWTPRLTTVPFRD